MFVTVGVPPQAWQAAQLRYASTVTQPSRHLMLIDGQQVAFANVKAGKQSDHSDQSVWLLPPQLSLVLLLYLGLIRPVEIALGKDQYYPLSHSTKNDMKS